MLVGLAHAIVARPATRRSRLSPRHPCNRWCRWDEADRERLAVARCKDSARGRGISERSRHVSCRVELGAAQRRPVNDARWVRPGDRGRGLRHVDRGCRRGIRVVEGVAGREADRERLAVARCKDSARGRGISERSRHVSCRVELGAAQRRPVNDARWVRPGDRRRGLRHVDRGCRRGIRVVEGVAGHEADRERLAVARTEDGARGRGIGERSRHVGRRVELRAAQRRPVDDARRVGPRDRRRGWRHVDRGCRRGIRVIDGVAGREADRERLAVARCKDSARGRGIGERSRYVGCRVELRATQRRPVDDARRVGPRDRGRGLRARRSRLSPRHPCSRGCRWARS